MSGEDIACLAISEDKDWRIRELSELVRACNDARSTRQDALMRAAIPVLYAHWEGFFVFSANTYLNFVASKGMMLSKLRGEFWTLAVRRRVKTQQIEGDAQFSRFLMEIRTESDRSFKRGNFDPINGMSNLRSNVLKWCCYQIGINADAFSTYFDFLDDHLVSRRNFIAHGQSIRIEIDSIAQYRDKVLDMMRIAENEIENSIRLQRYIRT